MKSRFTDQQIAFALQQAEAGTPVAEVCRKMGVSGATYFRWKQKYAGLMPSEVRRLRHLREATNAPMQSSHWTRSKIPVRSRAPDRAAGARADVTLLHRRLHRL